MKVFKFGGASLKDSTGVKNVASIIASEPSNNLLVVVSAMGKTTDMLERVLTVASSKQDYRAALGDLKKYHQRNYRRTIYRSFTCYQRSRNAFCRH